MATVRTPHRGFIGCWAWGGVWKSKARKASGAELWSPRQIYAHPETDWNRQRFIPRYYTAPPRRDMWLINIGSNRLASYWVMKTTFSEAPLIIFIFIRQKRQHSMKRKWKSSNFTEHRIKSSIIPALTLIKRASKRSSTHEIHTQIPTLGWPLQRATAG